DALPILSEQGRGPEPRHRLRRLSPFRAKNARAGVRRVVTERSRLPLVSCLMVTRDRPELARRAIACFLAQTWPHRELVIVDDGDRSYDDLVASYDDPRIRYVRLPSSPSQRLGALRNASQDLARGEYRVQWDDDEWYHPERIERQMRPILDEGWHASLLQYTLMHCDTP